MPRTKRKQQAQNTGPLPATSTIPTAGRPAKVDGASSGSGVKQKRKRKRKARTEVSDSSSSSSCSESSATKRKIKSKKQKKQKKQKADEERKGEEEEEEDTFETLVGKRVDEDGDTEVKDAHKSLFSSSSSSPSSSRSPSPSPSSEAEEGEGSDEVERDPQEGGSNKDLPDKSRRIPSPLLHRDLTDAQSAQRFEEYYMQLITSEFGEELNQVRKAKDFSERSLPMLVRALKMGVNVFEMSEKRTVVRSLGL